MLVRIEEEILASAPACAEPLGELYLGTNKIAKADRNRNKRIEVKSTSRPSFHQKA